MAAGLGTRMRSRRPKHLHELLGRRMVDWALDAVVPLGPSPLVVVVSPDTRPELDGTLPAGATLALQQVARGTGDAAAAGLDALGGFEGDVLVVPGDSPLLAPELVREVLETHRREGAAVTLLSIETEKPLPYGRVVRDPEGRVRRIVEEGDATDEERAIRELNASVYAFAAGDLRDALARLEPDNAQGELYLTDAVRLVADAGRPIATARTTVRPWRTVNGPITTSGSSSTSPSIQVVAGSMIVTPASMWARRMRSRRAAAASARRRSSSRTYR